MSTSQPPENGFRHSVGVALRRYMERKSCDQQTLAGRLNISPGMLSRYLNESATLGGDVLAIACADLGMSVDFHQKRIVAAVSEVGALPGANAVQLSFEFEQPLTLEGKTGSLAISVKPVQSEKLEFTVRILPRAG